MSMRGKFSLNGRRLNRSFTCPVKLEPNLLIATTVTELGGGLVAADVEPLNGIHFFAGIGVTNVTDIGRRIVLGPKGTIVGSATATIPTNQSVRGGIRAFTV